MNDPDMQRMNDPNIVNKLEEKGKEEALSLAEDIEPSRDETSE